MNAAGKWKTLDWLLNVLLVAAVALGVASTAGIWR